MKPSAQTVDSVILIVDSDQLSRLTLRDMLDALGWEVTACSTVAEAVHELTQGQYQIAIFSSLPSCPHVLKSVTEIQSIRDAILFLFLSGKPMSEEEQVPLTHGYQCP